MNISFLITISLLCLMVTTQTSAEDKDYRIENLPKTEFFLTKSLLNSDEDFNKKVSKELGKVSDDVRHFLEKVMRVAKNLLRDWILKNDDGSDARDTN